MNSMNSREGDMATCLVRRVTSLIRCNRMNALDGVCMPTSDTTLPIAPQDDQCNTTSRTECRGELGV